jgi:imidazolonepropionase-like amidohydrolase
VQKPIDVIRSATSNAAELFDMTGQIGVIAPGAYADMLVVDGDPLADINLLQEQGKHLDVIMKAGAFVVNRL